MPMSPNRSKAITRNPAAREGMDEKAYAVLLATAGDADRLGSLPDIRYPPVTTIREVYQQLMNYLQLPSGSGEGQYYDFDLTDFCRRFGVGDIRGNRCP